MKKLQSPFKFLDAYTLSDRTEFFGRDKEIEQLYQLIFKTPLLLVYGASGTGKTSLIQCGLASRFDGTDWLPLWIRREDDVNQALENAIHQALPDSYEKNKSISENITQLYQHYLRPVFLIFDQFEELFIFGKKEESEQFIQQVTTILDEELPCNIIIVIREEYLGHLYPFEKEIPELFDFRMRVEPMDSARVKQVLTSSFTQFNIQVEAPKEQRLDQIIENVSRGKSGIELPYLQVYLDRLYREDFIRTYPNKTFTKNAQGNWEPIEFTKTEISDFGTIDMVLDKFLDEQIEKIQREIMTKDNSVNKDAVRLLLDAFVSDEGTKRPIRYQRKDDQIQLMTMEENLPKLSPSQLNFCINALEESRLIRSDAHTLELAHDSLAAIIDKRRTNEQRQLNGIKRQIRSMYQNFPKTNEYLTNKQITVFEDFLPALYLSTDLNQFFQESQKFRTKETTEELEKIREQAEQERRLRENAEKNEGKAKRNTRVAMGISALAIFLAFIAWLQWEKSQDRFSTLLFSEAQKAFEIDNPRLSLRLGQESIKYDRNNILADSLINNKLVNYLAIFYPNSIIETYNFSGDSKYMIFLSELTKHSGKLNLLNLETMEYRTLSDIHYDDLDSHPFGFSNNSKYLSFFSEVSEKNGKLNILNLQTKELQSFPNSSIDIKFSNNDKFLYFFTEMSEDNGKLNILNLQTNELQSFPNSYNHRYDYGFSENSQYLSFFSEVSENNGKLNVLNLQTNDLKSFPNGYFEMFGNSYNYSKNSKYLSFFSEVSEGNGKLNILNLQTNDLKSFPKNINVKFSNNDKFLYFFSEVSENNRKLNILNLQTDEFQSFPYSSIDVEFSNNDKFLYFFTEVSENNGKLNILNLQTNEIQTILNCSRSHIKYSDNNEYLCFFTEISEGNGKLNVLNLQTKKPQSFLNCNVPHRTSTYDSPSFGYGFDKNSKYLIFFTDVSEERGKLNVLNLHNKNLQTFLNCYFNTESGFDFLNIFVSTGDGTEGGHYDFDFSNNSRYLSFFTKISDKKPVLNMLNLETKNLKIIPNCFKKIFTDNSKLMVSKLMDSHTFEVWNLDNMEKVKVIKHQGKIGEFKLSKNSKFLVSYSFVMGSFDKGTLKLNNLEIPQKKVFNYYDQFYEPINDKEKGKYGL